MTYTPKEFAFIATGSGWNIPAASVGLTHQPGGYGLLYVDHPEHGHMTLAGDADYLRLIVAGAGSGTGRLLADLTIPPDKFPLIRRGWPDEWEQPADPSQWLAIRA